MSFADFSREKLRNTDGFTFVGGAVFGAVISCITMVVTIWNNAVPPIVKAKEPNEAQRLEMIMIGHSEAEYQKTILFAEGQAKLGKRLVAVNGLSSPVVRCLQSKGFEVQNYKNAIFYITWSSL